MVYYCGHCDFNSIRVDNLEMHMETGCTDVDDERHIQRKKEKEETQKLIEECMLALYKLLQRMKNKCICTWK